ncbi:MAG: hypothetical protein ACJA0N_002380 [Pseudohongiellaceae bacterium]
MKNLGLFLEKDGLLADNGVMNSILKYMTYFLLLAVLSNGLFAAQMTAVMQGNVTSMMDAASSDLPCHGDEGESANAVSEPDCCNGDCSGCFISSHYMVSSSTVLSPTKALSISVVIDNHQLPQHNSSLYRPPIMV